MNDDDDDDDDDGDDDDDDVHDSALSLFSSIAFIAMIHLRYCIVLCCP